MSTNDFTHILNWRLLAGSHEFPGPDGGTCINEAAIVAAGFQYREVSNADDCPPCFSRSLAAYLIGLNDGMSDDLRPRLMPFVMRLSGSAGTAADEQARAEYIVVQTVRRILPLALERCGLFDHVERCRQVTTLQVAAEAAEAAARVAWVAWSAAEAAARVAAEAAEAAAGVWPVAIEIAEGAFAIGPQADPLDINLIRQRMDAARKVGERA